jgi:hypothetical protein
MGAGTSVKNSLVTIDPPDIHWPGAWRVAAAPDLPEVYPAYPDPSICF